MREKMALLVDAQYCSGCRTCEMACQQEHGYEPGKAGVKVLQLGPIQVNDKKWQYDFITVPTEFCNTCYSRRQKGKLPTCMQHCQGRVLQIGPLEELKGKITSDKHVLSVIR